jgi:hypothetical protein
LQYKTLHNTAKEIDHLIDHNLLSSGTSVISQEELKRILLNKFPICTLQAWVGTRLSSASIQSTKNRSQSRPKKSIENDHRAYKQVPENTHHKLFAKIFWHTKYCLLQEYGFPANVTKEELTRIRKIVNRYGVFDIKAENLKRIDDNLKIIDAHVSGIPIPYLLRKIDEAKSKLPKKLTKFLKTITKTLFEK